jgi:CheY-like chemotaxis protein
MTLPDWKDVTLLIAEDDEVCMEFLVELLTPSQINIVRVNDGKQAVESCLKNKAINLVLMDVRMPIMNGKDATIEIKKTRPELPIIAQTAFAMSGDKEKYLDSGFDDYISKPIIMEELIQKIKKFLTN